LLQFWLIVIYILSDGRQHRNWMTLWITSRALSYLKVSKFPPPNKLTLDPIGNVAPKWPERDDCDRFEPGALPSSSLPPWQHVEREREGPEAVHGGTKC